MENAKVNVKGADIYNVAQRVKTLLVNKDENANAAFTVFSRIFKYCPSPSILRNNHIN